MRHLKTKLTALALTALLLLSLTACGGKSGDSTASGPFAGMETTDLDGNAVDSSIFAENKLTVVNAWNIGCTPCIQEIPALDKLNREYASKGVAVVGLYYNFGDDLSAADRQEIDAIMQNAGATYLQILAAPSMLEFDELGQLAAFPTTFFVDSEGNIVDSVMGAREFENWTQVIDQVLKKLEK